MSLTLRARIPALLSQRSVQIGLAIGALVAAAAPFLPLARIPGFESALLCTWVLALLGGVLGLAAGRTEAARAREARFRRTTSARCVLGAWSSALLPGLLLLGAWVGWTALRASWSSPCSPTLGLSWYLVLPLPTLALATASGLVIGLLAPRAWHAGLAYALLLVVSLANTLTPLWRGPQIFAYDHFFGHLPGPIYDELFRIEPRLWIFRLLTLAWTAGALGLAVLLRRRWPTARDGSALPALGLCVLALLAVHWGRTHRTDLGLEQSTASVEARLGGLIEGEHCRLAYPREIPEDEARRLLLQCERRMAELGDFFGVDPGRAHVFLHRSASEKARLVGAAGTQFAKPWLGQVHVDRRGFPHPVLDHELAHVVAGRLGRRPFAVPARLLGLLPLPGLIEGAAVAADWPGGSLTVHEEARALRALGLAPDLPRILGAAGFWSQPAARAYTYAGSFLRWLVETRGPGPFASLYRDGDFEAAYGAPLRALVRQWEAFLDREPLSPELLAMAEERLRRPSIFGQACAREVAVLRNDAVAARAAGDHRRAAELYARVVELAPHDGGALLGLASARLDADDPEGVWELAALSDSSDDRSAWIRGQLWTLAGDAMAEVGDLERARQAYERAAALPQEPASARALVARLEAAGDPDLARAVLPYLRRGRAADLLAVREILDARSDWAIGWYLVGRRHHQDDRHEDAVRDLRRALDAGLPGVIEREARTLLGLSLAWLGDSRGCETLEALAEEGPEGARLQAAKLTSLCRGLGALER